MDKSCFHNYFRKNRIKCLMEVTAMRIIRDLELEESRSCSYFPERVSRYRCFLACGLSPSELDGYLLSGWRKFGIYFFRPECSNCRECQPLRVKTNEFRPSKSQRRVLAKNSDVELKLQRLNFREDVYQLYLKHSTRFKKTEITSREQFMSAFTSESVPGFQSLYYLGDELIAAGFLDVSELGLSTVYFVFDPEHAKRSLGTYSILKEIQISDAMKKKYYFLGYWIKNHPSMNYKNRFSPFEIYEWEQLKWIESSGGE